MLLEKVEGKELLITSDSLPDVSRQLEARPDLGYCTNKNGVWPLPT